jgi:hypothetical protein
MPPTEFAEGEQSGAKASLLVFDQTCLITRRLSSVVEQHFCKVKVPSSNLGGGSTACYEFVQGH